MAFAVDGASAPTIVNSSVARTREYLTGPEVEKLMEAAPASLFVAPHLASLVQDAGLAHDVARLVQWKRQRVQRQQVQW